MLQLWAPVSSSFPSCSRLLWEMRFSRVTAFRRCFRLWKRGCQVRYEENIFTFSHVNWHSNQNKEHYAPKKVSKIVFCLIKTLDFRSTYNPICTQRAGKYLLDHTNHKLACTIYTQGKHKYQHRPLGQRHACLSPTQEATPGHPSVVWPSGSYPAISPSPPDHLKAQGHFSKVLWKLWWLHPATVKRKLIQDHFHADKYCSRTVEPIAKAFLEWWTLRMKIPLKVAIIIALSNLQCREHRTSTEQKRIWLIQHSHHCFLNNVK